MGMNLHVMSFLRSDAGWPGDSEMCSVADCTDILVDG